MHDKFGKEMTKKEREKCVITLRKNKKEYSMMILKKKQLRKYEKEGKKFVRHNLDDEKKEHLKKEDNKRKKEKCANLGDNEKE